MNPNLSTITNPHFQWSHPHGLVVQIFGVGWSPEVRVIAEIAWWREASRLVSHLGDRGWFLKGLKHVETTGRKANDSLVVWTCLDYYFFRGAETTNQTNVGSES